MAPRGGFDTVMQRKSGIVPPIVHAQFLTTGMHGQPIGLPSDSSCRRPGAVCQQVADALAPDHFFDQLDDGRTVAPGQLQAIGIVPGQKPLLVTFHGKRDRTTGRNRIHAGPVQHVIEGIDTLSIVVQQQPPQRHDRLVLRFVTAGPGAVFGHQPATSQRTTVTMVFYHHRVGEYFRA